MSLSDLPDELLAKILQASLAQGTPIQTLVRVNPAFRGTIATLAVGSNVLDMLHPSEIVAKSKPWGRTWFPFMCKELKRRVLKLPTRNLSPFECRLGVHCKRKGAPHDYINARGIMACINCGDWIHGHCARTIGSMYSPGNLPKCRCQKEKRSWKAIRLVNRSNQDGWGSYEPSGYSRHLRALTEARDHYTQPQVALSVGGKGLKEVIKLGVYSVNSQVSKVARDVNTLLGTGSRYWVRAWNNRPLQDGTLANSNIRYNTELELMPNPHELITVIVKQPGNKQVAYSNMVPSGPVELLKSAIESLTGISVKHQQLTFGGKSLQNDKTLFFYNITADSTINLTFGLKGGALKKSREYVSEGALVIGKSKIIGADLGAYTTRSFKKGDWIPCTGHQLIPANGPERKMYNMHVNEDFRRDYELSIGDKVAVTGISIVPGAFTPKQQSKLRKANLTTLLTDMPKWQRVNESNNPSGSFMTTSRYKFAIVLDRDIGKGKEITVCYGPYYKRKHYEHECKHCREEKKKLAKPMKAKAVGTRKSLRRL